MHFNKYLFTNIIIKNMKKYFLTLFAASAVLFSSCGGSSSNTGKDGESTENTEEAAAVDENWEVARSIDSTYTYDGKEVTFVGKYDARHMSIIRNNKFNAGLEVKSGDKKKNISNIEFTFGKGKNSIYFPDEYMDNQIEIYDNEGNKLAHNALLKITGTLKYTHKGPKAKPWENPKLPESARKALKAAEDRRIEREGEGDGNDYSYIIKDIVITSAEPESK